ncbi:MAG: metallophosphoesterase [Clostridia bacterium]|nr:metallophosphoesterase [Clostridia bacterium]
MSYTDKLTFKNKQFTILQVADPQDLQFVRRTMLNMLDRAYDTVKPDLVVLTGDQVLGNHLRDCNRWTMLTVKDKAGEKLALRTALIKLLDPIERRKIPFAMIYGNHDDMNLITKEEQADIYREYEYCVGLDEADPSVECDTYNIPIYAEDGVKMLWNLWMLDSARYDKTEKRSHHYVTPETAAWYEKKSAELKEANGGVSVPSLMFQHIPLPETLELIEECDKKDAAIGAEGKYYRLKSDVYGILGEYPSVCEKQVGQFDAMKRCGDVRAVVAGHDHLNSFVGNIGGIDFIQTGGASFRCYGSGKARSVRVFTLYENGTYETKTISYWDLCGRTPVSAFRYYWDADEMAYVKGYTLGAAALAAVTAGAVCAIKKHMK